MNGAASASKQAMGPPPQDTGPFQSSSTASNATTQDNIQDKYKRLKRRYFELEEKQSDTSYKLRKSGELNVSMREERDSLLSRIVELEGLVQEPLQPHQAPSSAWPRSHIDSARARAGFFANLRSAVNEVDDPEVDPLANSRHVGPRFDAAMQDDQGKAMRKSIRKSKSSRGHDVNDSRLQPQMRPPEHGPSPGYQHGSPHMYTSPYSPQAAHAHRPPSRNYEAPHDYRGPAPHISAPQPTNGHFQPFSASSHYRPTSAGDESMGSPPPTTGESSKSSYPTLDSLPKNGEAPRPSKPKRLKAHTVTSKTFSIPTVPRGADGEVVLPLNVGIMTVLSLGHVVDREHWYTERYIYPAGYEVSRRYFSTINPNVEVVYHCKILDGGSGPQFQIIASDVPLRPMVAGNPSGAWQPIIKAANLIRNRQHSGSVSGPDFFGLGQNTIKHLIQLLPGARTLPNYVWQNFVEGGPLGGRHAAVNPAIPEDYDPPAQPPDPANVHLRRVSMSEQPPQQTSEAQRMQPALPHTIVLPSGDEGLRISEYRPPPLNDHRPALPLSSFYQGPPSLASGLSHSPHPHQLPPMNNIQHQLPPIQPGPERYHTPYAGAVPQKFASLMNAYPPPPPLPSAYPTPPPPSAALTEEGGP